MHGVAVATGLGVTAELRAVTGKSAIRRRPAPMGVRLGLIIPCLRSNIAGEVPKGESPEKTWTAARR